MKYCENCGAQLEDSALFCEECGTKQQTVTESHSHQQTDEPIEELSVSSPDKDTVKITVRGIPFNLKFVGGKDYGTEKEFLPYFISETPVTQALWYVITGENPSSDISNLQFPVTNINLSMATSFLVKLNKLTGIKFELPTLKQWNFAYTGGNMSKGFKYSGSDNLAEVGWNDNKLHPVGELYPNELGLVDMEGNVEEILKDNKWAFISKNSKKKRSDDNLSGIRLLVNIPADSELEPTTPLQTLIATRQQELLAERDRIIEENERIKEEKREKAEKEARIRAEEKARKKAEEEAKKKAEAEERKRKEEEQARLKAERKAKEQAEKEAKIKELKLKVKECQSKDDALKKELEKINSILKEKKDLFSTSENTVRESREEITKIDHLLDDLKKRFNVILLKRVEYGLFNSKGQKFDEMLMHLTLTSKDDIKEWNSILRKDKRVTLVTGIEKEEAEIWKRTIEDAGGQVTVETSTDDLEYDDQKEEYEDDIRIAKNRIENAEKTLDGLKEEIEDLEKKHSQLENEYSSAHLDLKRNELELKFIETDSYPSKFIEQEYADKDNRAALFEMFGYEYEKYHQIQEERRIEAEKERHKEEEKARKKAEEERKKKELQEMKDSVTGIAFYSNENNIETAYKTVYAKDISDFEETIENLTNKTDKALKSGKIKWKEYIDDDYHNRHYLYYTIIDKDILLVNGKGKLPDIVPPPTKEVFFDFSNPKVIHPDVLKIKDKIKSLVITGNITKLGARYFKDFLNLENVVMPDSIEIIPESVFFGDKSLKTIKLSSCLKEIKNGAFEDNAIEHIVIPESCQKIEKEAFKDCTKLKTVLIPRNTIVEDGAFSGCDKL